MAAIVAILKRCVMCGSTEHPLDEYGYCKVCNDAMRRINDSGVEP